MATFTFDDVPHAYDESGRGVPLLLIHAGIADRRMWDEVLPALAERHRVVRVDLRGYGQTPLPDGRFVHATDVARLLAGLGIPRAHVCGVSFGSGIALDLAIGRPEVVDRLVLVAPGLPGWRWGPEMEAYDLAETAALERGDLDEAAWLNVRFWVDGPSRGPSAVAAPVRQRVHEMQRRAFEHENPAADEAWLVPDRHDRLGQVAARTLVVAGDLDQPDIRAISAHVAGAIPGARLEVMPGVAHLPPVEAPDAFARLVLDHLAS